jgi:hypothetical protein
MLTYEPRTGVVLAGTLDGFVDLLIERCGTYSMSPKSKLFAYLLIG